MAGKRLHRTFETGFTLIELLVVVAIISLLVAMLLPALSKARAQARTTLCASRLGQLTKAMFLYAEDFNERFPFHIVYGEIPAWGGGGRDGGDVVPEELDPNEDWLASKDQMLNVFFTEQEDWPDLGVDLPRSGCLFGYTRFADLYACPDFARRPGNDVHSVKMHSYAPGDQRAFNYTRTPWARKPDFEWGSGMNLTFDGPILTASMAHAPSAALLLIDESWYAHVGRGRPADPGNYRGADPVWDISSSVGMYHGAPVLGEVWYTLSSPCLLNDVGVKRGNVAAYDAHVELYRDPCPAVDSNNGRNILSVYIAGSVALVDMIQRMVYALVGRDIGIKPF